MVTCYEWRFTNSPYKSYVYCETIQECRKAIERQYNTSDYIITKKCLFDDIALEIVNEIDLVQQLPIGV